MKRTLALIAAATFPGAALADDYDYVPEAPVAEEQRINLCEHKAVQEVARIERDLRPVKELYDIATNPTGFAIKVVSREVGVKIPRWVGFAMDPQGAVRTMVMKEVLKELKRIVGLQDDCAAELDEAPAPEEA